MKQRTAKVDWDVLGKDLRKTWNSRLTVGCQGLRFVEGDLEGSNAEDDGDE